MDQKETLTARFRRFSESEMSSKTALISFDGNGCEQRLTYKAFYDSIMRAGAYLRENGLAGKGSRCLVVSDDDMLRVIVLFFAVTAAGAAAVPVQADVVADKFNRCKYIAENSGADTILAESSCEDMRRLFPDKQVVKMSDCLSYRPKREPEFCDSPGDEFMLLYTSGSTGEPKAVIYTHAMIGSFAELYSKKFHRDPSSAAIVALPIHHAFGNGCTFFPQLWGGGPSIVVRPDTFINDPKKWFELVTKYKVTHMATLNYTLSVLSDLMERSPGDVAGSDLSSLRALTIGGEYIQADTVSRFASLAKPHGFDPRCFSVCYGMTELMILANTPYFSGLKKADAAQRDSEYRTRDIFCAGEVTGGRKVFCLDDNDLPVPNGSIGNICVTVDPVMKKFTGLDSAEADGNICYKTGDVGFVLDGDSGAQEIYICGRSKDILNIKGELYSPFMLEEIVENVDDRIIKAVALSVLGENTEELVIIAECSGKGSQRLADKINEAVIKRLPIEVKKAVFVKEASLPRTQMGKLMRKEVRKKIALGESFGETFIPVFKFLSDKTDTRESIVSFLKAFAGKDDVSFDAELGTLWLNSLQAQLLAARTGLKITDIFSAKTLEELIEKAGDTAGDDGHSGIEKKFPLNAVQRAYITGRSDEVDWGGVPCQYYTERDVKGLDARRFTAAVKALMERHPMLRSVVRDNAYMETLDVFSVPVSAEHFCENIAEIAEQTRGRMTSTALPLDAPLFEIALHELKKDLWRIQLRIDMICCDAMSMLVFWNDLRNIYSGETLPEIASVAASDDTALLEDIEYWDKKAADFPPMPQLPYNTLCEKTLCGKIRRYQYLIEKDRFKAFETLMRKLGLTPSAAFMALFVELLSAYGAGREPALNVTVMGRKIGDAAGSFDAGEFTRLLLFAAHRRDTTVLDNALRIQDDLRRDMSHISVKGADVARKIAEHSDQDVVYPIVFTSLLGLEKLTGERSIFSSRDFSASSTPQVLLDHQLLPSEEGVILNWDIAEEAFEDGIARSMFEAYKKLMTRALEEPFWHSRITDIRSDEDKAVQHAANDTAASIPERSLTEGFIRFSGDGDRIAVVYRGAEYSYAQLEKHSARYGEMLMRAGVGKRDRVMVQMPKSFELIAAILAIVRIGGVYVPMPFDQPESRQLEIFGKCSAKGIIADGSVATHNSIPRFSAETVRQFEGKIVDAEISGDDLAYIIFTSGSTGAPKGVAITHAAAMNTIAAVNRYLDLDGTDTLIGLSFVSFDLSVYDVFGALSAGASLAVPTEAECIDPAAWLAMCKAQKVTVWNTVPALMDIFLDNLKAADGSGLRIRDVILSGDWIPMDLFDRLQKFIPSAKLTSMGGATEASIWSNYFPVEKVEETWRSIPYGYPLPNQFFHILDDFGRFLPCGVRGRLNIGGKGLAQGYYNEPELTAEVFRDIGGERLYDTGDYGRYDKNGCVVFLGRKDAQIKVNGYRIELGEIQNALEKLGHPENVIVVSGNAGSPKQMIAFVRSSKVFSEAECKKALTELLPHYFVPKRVVAVKAFPMTANGKIDRKKLLADLKVGRRHTKHAGVRLSEQDRKVLSIIGSELKMADLSPEDTVSELGLTSLSLIKLANRLESEMGCRARINDIIRYKNVRDFLAFYDNEENSCEKEAHVSSSSLDDPYDAHPVMEVLRDELELPDLCSKDLLKEVGLSSIAVIRTANRLDLIYGFRPSVQEISGVETARQLIDFYGDAQPITEETDCDSAVKELVNQCRSLNITIWAEDGKLKFKAPKGALTSELKKRLSESREKLIKYLDSMDGIVVNELTALQTAYVVGRQNRYALGDITANYYVEYQVENLDVRALERALNEVVRKNEILRTVIYANGTAKALAENPGYHIEMVPDDSSRDLREEMVSYTFELGQWPMFDIKVKMLDKDRGIVHVDIDCLILDGWSIRSFLSQLLSAYMGKEAVTTDYSFRQYLADEQKWLKEKQYYSLARKYWEEQINKLPPAPHLPMKTPLTQIRKPEFSRMTDTLEDQLSAKLWEKIRRYDLTPSLVLCTAYMMSLSKWSENPDVTLNLTMFNRQPVHPDVQQVLGDFTNIALIGYKHKECSFLAHTKKIGRQLWNAIEYRSCNVINMLGILAKKYDDEIAVPYVFTSLIDVDNDMGHEMLSRAGFTEIFAQTRTPQVLLDHQLYYSGGKLVLGMDYVRQAFDEKMLEQMFSDYTERVRTLAVTDDWEKL